MIKPAARPLQECNAAGKSFPFAAPNGQKEGEVKTHKNLLGYVGLRWVILGLSPRGNILQKS